MHLTTVTDQLIPANPEAEQAVLGSLLIDPDALVDDQTNIVCGASAVIVGNIPARDAPDRHFARHRCHHDAVRDSKSAHRERPQHGFQLPATAGSRTNTSVTGPLTRQTFVKLAQDR